MGYDKNGDGRMGGMRPISLPDVPYGSTAVRPSWSDLPESLREAISSRLGGPIAAAQSAGGGFTRAFAAVLTTSTGARAFVKAAPLEDPTAHWYAREASITASLPAIVAAARPRWTLVDSGYFVLCGATWSVARSSEFGLVKLLAARVRRFEGGTFSATAKYPYCRRRDQRAAP